MLYILQLQLRVTEVWMPQEKLVKGLLQEMFLAREYQEIYRVYDIMSQPREMYKYADYRERKVIGVISCIEMLIYNILALRNRCVHFPITSI